MKNVIMRVFLFGCGTVFIVESIALFMIRMGYFDVSVASQMYNSLFQTTSRLDMLLACAACFGLVGLVLMFRVFWGIGQSKAIIIKDKGEVVRIPAKTIKDFIAQIIDLNSALEDVKMIVKPNRKWIDLKILCSYTGDQPVSTELHRVKEIIKTEMNKVFDFTYVRINFQLEGISIETTKDISKFNSASGIQSGYDEETKSEGLDWSAEDKERARDGDTAAEASEQDMISKGLPWIGKTKKRNKEYQERRT